MSTSLLLKEMLSEKYHFYSAISSYLVYLEIETVEFNMVIVQSTPGWKETCNKVALSFNYRRIFNC